MKIIFAIARVVGDSVMQWAAGLAAVAASVAFVFIGLRAAASPIPPFLVWAGWIVLAGVVLILAIVLFSRVTIGP